MSVKNPDLLPLFDQVKTLMEPFAAAFDATVDEPGHYELYTREPVDIGRGPVRPFFFAGLTVQKHYLGFYFMPVYLYPALAERIGPDLRPLLKGKSCFQLKRMSPELQAQIPEAIALGLEFYRQRGWL